MSDKTVTRADLVETLFEEVGLSRSECARLLDDVLNQIADCLAGGENVKYYNFGGFSVRRKGLRMGRNPRTGEEIPIPPRNVVVFRPSRNLRKWVNHPHQMPRWPRRQLDLFDR